MFYYQADVDRVLSFLLPLYQADTYVMCGKTYSKHRNTIGSFTGDLKSLVNTNPGRLLRLYKEWQGVHVPRKVG